MISLENLTTIFPNTDSKKLEIWVDPLNKFLPLFEINTNLRTAMFLAQIGFESAFFTVIINNFYYSAATLMAYFPTYFTPESAKDYELQPYKIVEYVYSGRMGNDPAPSPDAWTYRERGLIQLCGKDNYTAFAKFKNMTLDEVVKYLETNDGCVEVACWYFKMRGLLAVADTGDVVKATHLINGGENGLAGRQKLYEIARKVFP